MLDFAGIGRMMRCSENGVFVGSLYVLQNAEPVSYTHLDVYKRQAKAFIIIRLMKTVRSLLWICTMKPWPVRGWCAIL